MNILNSPNNFPLWQFLNQPVFNSQTKLILNPRQFEHLYKIDLLERCLTQECSSKKYNVTE
ncbi:hypothetical protein C7B70_01270 [Chlorogloea sp. CCALA 695]|nr:hypothetical protein C7B70_01270 [Chlorogloea sp. CCALA 695]